MTHQATYRITDGKAFGVISAFRVSHDGRVAYVMSLADARRMCDDINKDGVSFSEAFSRA